MSTSLRRTALFAAAMSAAGSVGFTLYAGRRNPSAILMSLFVGWVLAPYAAYWWADRASKTWPVGAQIALHAVGLIVALTSLAIYGYVALGPPRTKTAAPFLIVPPVSCVVGGITLWMVSAITPKNKR